MYNIKRLLIRSFPLNLGEHSLLVSLRARDLQPARQLWIPERGEALLWSASAAEHD